MKHKNDKNSSFRRSLMKYWLDTKTLVRQKFFLSLFLHHTDLKYFLTGNMERWTMSNAHQTSDDPMHANPSQEKILEINPGHPLIKGETSKTKRFFVVIIFSDFSIHFSR